MKKGVLVLLAGFAIALGSVVQAEASATILFDPTGGGGGFNIDLMDPTVGNALSIGLNGTSAVGATGTLLFQANLGLTSLSGVGNYLNGGGGNFFTIVAGFSEKVLSNDGAGGLTFGPNPSANGSVQGFFDIYRQSAIGDNLNGTGFAGGTGTLILSGSIINNIHFFGNFDANLANFGLLDQSQNGDQWAGETTVTGGGQFSADILVNSALAGYFPNMVAGTSFVFATSQQHLPFQGVDPSRCFSNNGTANCNTLSLPLIGAVNGTGGATLLQTDASLTFLAPTTVPEPASLTLLGFGLLSAAAARRRQAQNKK